MYRQTYAEQLSGAEVAVCLFSVTKVRVERRHKNCRRTIHNYFKENP